MENILITPYFMMSSLQNNQDEGIGSDYIDDLYEYPV